MTDNLIAERTTGIGSTDASVILGLHPWKTPLELYVEKIGESEEEQPLDKVCEENGGSRYDPAYWGNVLEPVVAKEYCIETGDKQVSTGSRFRRNDLRPWQICHLDRMVERDGNKRILEVKTAGSWSYQSWQDGDIPPWYNAQVQHQLSVTEMSAATIVCLVGGQSLIWRDIERDEKFVSEMNSAEQEFWDRIESREPPEARSGDQKILSRMFPEEFIGKRIELPPESSEWYEMIKDAKLVKAEAENIIDKCNSLLRQSLGDAEIGILPNNAGAYTLKTTNRKAFTVKEKSFRQLRHTDKI